LSRVKEGTDYSVIIYDKASGHELKRFVNYDNPEWHPDGRLLITGAVNNTNSFGIYLNEETLTDLTCIDQE